MSLSTDPTQNSCAHHSISQILALGLLHGWTPRFVQGGCVGHVVVQLSLQLWKKHMCNLPCLMSSLGDTRSLSTSQSFLLLSFRHGWCPFHTDAIKNYKFLLNTWLIYRGFNKRNISFNLYFVRQSGKHFLLTLKRNICQVIRTQSEF